MLLLDVSTPHGTELHLDVAPQQEPFADPGRAYTTQACPAPGLVGKTEACTWTCLDNYNESMTIY